MQPHRDSGRRDPSARRKAANRSSLQHRRGKSSLELQHDEDGALLAPRRRRARGETLNQQKWSDSLELQPDEELRTEELIHPPYHNPSTGMKDSYQYHHRSNGSVSNVNPRQTIGDVQREAVQGQSQPGAVRVSGRNHEDFLSMNAANYIPRTIEAPTVARPSTQHPQEDTASPQRSMIQAIPVNEDELEIEFQPRKVGSSSSNFLRELG